MAAWHQIDFETQYALVTWLNVTPVDAIDKRRLARLFSDSNFLAYDCAHCGDRVRHASPNNWSHFQGVDQNEGCGELCANCYGLYEKLQYFVG